MNKLNSEIMVNKEGMVLEKFGLKRRGEKEVIENL
jgi:hypothetical protein